MDPWSQSPVHSKEERLPFHPHSIGGMWDSTLAGESHCLCGKN